MKAVQHTAAIAGSQYAAIKAEVVVRSNEEQAVPRAAETAPG